jgi:hypothetical protein
LSVLGCRFHQLFALSALELERAARTPH